MLALIILMVPFELSIVYGFQKSLNGHLGSPHLWITNVPNTAVVEVNKVSGQGIGIGVMESTMGTQACLHQVA